MPAQLRESELFGHVRGAFTDARIFRPRRMLGAALGQRGHRVVVAASAAAAIDLLINDDTASVELLISDVRTPKTAGFQLVPCSRQRAPPLPVVLITACGGAQTHGRAAEIGASEVFDKCFELRRLFVTPWTKSSTLPPDGRARPGATL